MKKLLLLLSLCFIVIAYPSCSKDDDGIDRNCGVVFSKDVRVDGGIEEVIIAEGCGDQFRFYAENGNPETKTVIYKGQTRSVATYLVLSRQITQTSTIQHYIRYESGQVPDTAVYRYEQNGWDTDIQELTGLERVQW